MFASLLVVIWQRSHSGTSFLSPHSNRYFPMQSMMLVWREDSRSLWVMIPWLPLSESWGRQSWRKCYLTSAHCHLPICSARRRLDALTHHMETEYAAIDHTGNLLERKPHRDQTKPTQWQNGDLLCWNSNWSHRGRWRLTVKWNCVQERGE